jgi:hypothetical protein
MCWPLSVFKTSVLAVEETTVPVATPASGRDVWVDDWENPGADIINTIKAASSDGRIDSDGRISLIIGSFEI